MESVRRRRGSRKFCHNHSRYTERLSWLRWSDCECAATKVVLGSHRFQACSKDRFIESAIQDFCVCQGPLLHQADSSASLPAIGNLFLLWATLFLFFAILFIEVFGLTKLGNNSETRFQNYYTFGNALIMLAFMSTG